jgi:hypothetical protein
VIIGVVFWPLVLTAAIVISPFALPFYLGAKKRAKMEEEEKLLKKNNK